MANELKNALEQVDLVYNDLVEIADGIIKRCTSEADSIVGVIKKNVNNLSNDAIREATLRLSTASYSFSEIKEKSALKAMCAEILRKELFAKEFNKAEGPVAVKDNIATINVSENILVEAVHSMVASALKVKLDEMHRVVDALKTVTMSRMSEAKLTINADLRDTNE